MQTKEVAEKINKLLDNFAGLKITFLGQEPYRGDCWKIFSQASADIRTDELMDAVKELFDAQSTKTDLKLELLEELSDKWREWSYARQKLGIE